MSNPELTRRASIFDRRAHAMARAMTPRSGRRRSASRKLAVGLGWFGIGLGLLELFAGRRVSRISGTEAAVPLMTLYGVREVVSSAGLAGSRTAARAAPWAWARVAGDAIDLATLVASVAMPGRRRGRLLASLVAVGGVTLLDMACARGLRSEANAARQRTDYSDRSGWPEQIHAKGVADRPVSEPPGTANVAH